ncbi:unnamed protein product, partial [Hapterophycus canaliculatus]
MSSYRAALCAVAAIVLSCAQTSAFVAPTAARGAMSQRRSSPLSRSSVPSRQAQRQTSALCMEAGKQTFLDDPMLIPLEDDDYVAFGIACCFVMNDNLKLD